MDYAEIPLSDKEFARIKGRVLEVAGISLGEAKRTLVISRLTKVVKALNLKSFSAYVDFLDRVRDPGHDQDFVNALTTNLTRFYREDHHFAHLVGCVGRLMAHPPRKAASGKPRLRIWSAGCSTGQEPYTIALCLLGAYPELRRWDFRILATDIDTNVLAKAATGTYPESELSGLSAEQAAMFERPGDGTIRVPLPVRSLITFKPLNLMGEWPVKGPFDAIFCRNVAIYFDKTTQKRMFDRFAELLAPGAHLYIGHSENLGTSSALFSPVGKTTYRPRPAARSKDAA